jgi:hypothetical protein
MVMFGVVTVVDSAFAAKDGEPTARVLARHKKAEKDCFIKHIYKSVSEVPASAPKSLSGLPGNTIRYNPRLTI